jgi:DNA-binding SARP family transcriptional activator
MVALLFTDLVGSTEGLVRLGDEAGESLRRAHFALLRGVVAQWRGEEVKNLGDGMMVAFASAVDALDCAAEIQRDVRRRNENAGAPLSVRIGIHAGEPVRDEDDYFGLSVVIAKRLCDAAAGSQILVSDLVRGLVGPRGQHQLRPVGRLALKGLDERISAYDVLWLPEGQTAQVPQRGVTSRLSRQSGILRSRLLRPHPPPGALARPQLLHRLQEGLRGRLLAVVAGAGYGKSTLLAQGIEELSEPCVWLSCDQRLGAAESFLAHLAEGLTECFPGVGGALDLVGPPSEQAATLCNEVVETIAEDFVVVVDDVHALEGRPAADALASLVWDLPRNAHLALASRTALSFPLGRLRAAGELTELAEADLALSLDESATLLSRLPGDLGDRAAELHRRSEGWVAGLILAARAGPADGRPAPQEFDYMAEEVLAHQPPDVRDFLLDTAVLSRISPELAGAVSGRPDAALLLAMLVRQRLFTVRLGGEGEWYRYHHLLTAYLRRELAAGDPRRLEGLHRRAATAWVAAGQPLEAVRHHIEGGDWSGAAETLEPVAEDVAASPDAGALDTWLQAMPFEYLGDRPSLILARATRLLGRADNERSFAAFEEAIEMLHLRGDDERAAVALFRLMQAMFAAGTRPDHRAAVGARWLGRLDPSARMVPAARVVQAIGCAYARRFAEAEQELDLSVGASDASPAIALYAAAVRAHYLGWGRDGRPEALAALDEPLGLLVRDPDLDELAFLPWLLLLRAYLLNDMGMHEEALDEIGRSAEAARRRGLSGAPGRPPAWVRSVALAGLGRWEELEAELAPPDRVPSPNEATAYAHRYQVSAALLAASRGDHVAATAHVRLAREELRSFGKVSDDPALLCDLAVATHWIGEAELAAELAREAHVAAREIGAHWQLARAALVGGAVEVSGPDADALLDEALTLTADPAFEALWTRRERRLAAPLLARALSSSLGPPGLAGRLLARCGGEVLTACARDLVEAPAPVRVQLAAAAGEAVAADGELVDALLRDRDATVREAARRSWVRLRERPRAALRIATLGELRVWRDGVAVPDGAFGRQKARALLGLLLSRNHPVHREELCEVLWADLRPERAAAALRTTLHDLRRALQPELDATSPAAAVVADGTTVRIELSSRDELDLAALEAVAASLRTREPVGELAHLEEIVTLYRGPFLSEWPYEDWAAARREEAEEAYRTVLEALAAALGLAGRHHAAAERWRRLVALDAEREGWHRGLMASYAAAGERALALRQFHVCRAVLRRRQGIEPGRETRDLYAAILREDEGGGEPERDASVTATG